MNDTTEQHRKTLRYDMISNLGRQADIESEIKKLQRRLEELRHENDCMQKSYNALSAQ